MSSSKPTPPPPRRVPPPCWTHEETLALIESYHEKWYSLRRGNLKASHWQEVSESVAQRCPFAVPSKTSVQCRHKIEKLRKRYRTEKQRAAANAPHRYSSSWNFFNKMDDMEKGPLLSSSPLVDSQHQHQDDDDDDDDDDDADDIINTTVQQINSPINYHRLISNGSGAGGRFKFKIPSGSTNPIPIRSPLGLPGSWKPKSYEHPKFYSTPTPTPNPNPNHNNYSNSTPGKNPDPIFLNTASLSKPGYGRSDGGGGVGVKRESDPVGDMVSSIRMLGEGFVRMEQKKMEMAREMEQMRMEMEIKRTEMILESQQKIVEAFAKGIFANKKMKRMPSPES